MQFYYTLVNGVLILVLYIYMFKMSNRSGHLMSYLGRCVVLNFMNFFSKVNFVIVNKQ